MVNLRENNYHTKYRTRNKNRCNGFRDNVGSSVVTVVVVSVVGRDRVVRFFESSTVLIDLTNNYKMRVSNSGKTHYKVTATVTEITNVTVPP